MIDLLVTGGAVLTADAEDTYVPDGAVAVHDGRIVAVGTAAELGASHPARDTVDARGCLVLPGLVNAHAHSAMTLFRGRADDVDLQVFLARLVAAESAVLTAEAVETAVRLALAESIRAGVTTAMDMYWFPEAGLAAADQAGFRLVTGPTFMDVPGPPDGLDFAERLRRAPELLRGSATRCVTPHSAYTLDPEQLLAVAELAREHGALLHIHAAENAVEVETVRGRYGCRPVELLHHLGLLGPGTLLAHAVCLTDAEIALIAASGAGVAHCPVSNLKLASGVARLPELLAAGVPVGLGTDGAVSSNALDLFAPIRAAAVLHRATPGGATDPTAIGARTAVRMATAEGARAIGIGALTGSLEVGKAADLVVLDLNRPHLTPRHDPWSMLAYAAGPADVRDTVIGGRVVMRDRRLLTIDESAAIEELTALAATLPEPSGRIGVPT
ncbi:amidohydrolase family protein [Embleya sp. NBC_00896]|uniref:amidohydrolase family protein n=1 Tax=Embleya sp. NBC_00896 TaxID=2975961 RepID=UPI00386FC68A|nr:amidohydrolase [Embleya sp. NBC_00896]